MVKMFMTQVSAIEAMQAWVDAHIDKRFKVTKVDMHPVKLQGEPWLTIEMDRQAPTED